MSDADGVREVKVFAVPVAGGACVMAVTQADYDTLRQALEAARGELADRDTVPRSRYNACNDDWLKADAKLKEVSDNAVRLIAEYEQRAEQAEARARVAERIRELLDKVEAFKTDEYVGGLAYGIYGVPGLFGSVTAAIDAALRSAEGGK